jgi:hypothetical protein
VLAVVAELEEMALTLAEVAVDRVVLVVNALP